jgi:hypothetical protein
MPSSEIHGQFRSLGSQNTAPDRTGSTLGALGPSLTLKVDCKAPFPSVLSANGGRYVQDVGVPESRLPDHYPPLYCIIP